MPHPGKRHANNARQPKPDAVATLGDVADARSGAYRALILSPESPLEVPVKTTMPSMKGDRPPRSLHRMLLFQA